MFFRWKLALLLASCGVACWAQQPNFVILFADDAGYADFGFQPACRPEMAAVTPRLTRLAEEGIRFTDAYVSGCVCSPSRAGLLTGRYQQRFGHEMNLPRTESQGGLPLDERLFGDYLRPGGYATGLIGKWHLGYPPEYQPTRRGFDYFFGFLQGARPYYPLPPARAEKHRLFQENGQLLPEEGYSTDRIGDAACQFLETHQQRPFFMFVSFNAVHGPLQARRADLEKLVHVPAGKHRQYVGMMQALDENIARILAKLDDLELTNKTLVIFTNDNGGQTQNTANNAPLRGRKGQLWEGGIRVPLVARWPGVIRPGRVSGEPVSTLDLLPTCLAAAEISCDRELDGCDLMPLLRDETNTLPDRSLYWRHNGPQGPISVRCGDWKLIHERNRRGAVPELYHLPDDVAETTDRAREHPEMVRQLADDLRRWESQLMEPLWERRGR